MEKSKGLILIVVGIAAVLIVWKVAFSPTNTTPVDKPSTSSNDSKQPAGNNVSNPTAEQDNRAMRGGNRDQGNTQTERQGRNNNTQGGRTSPAYAVENLGLKISIPADVNAAKLQVLYNEYQKISPARTSRGGRGDRGGDFQGMDMESFGGMGGRGGGMGGPGGGMMGMGF